MGGWGDGVGVGTKSRNKGEMREGGGAGGLPAGVEIPHPLPPLG